MKYFYNFFKITMVLSLLLIMGCQKDMLYSCDESVNNWVYSNLESIRGMTRSEWQSLDYYKRIPAYRALSQEQRLLFWNDKLDNVLTVNWTEEEKESITYLKTFLNETPHILSGIESLSETEKDRANSFFNTWTENGITNYDWNQDLIIAMVGRLEDFSIAFNAQTRLDPNQNIEEEKCNCNYGSFIEWCGMYSECLEVDCSDSTVGCGFFLAYSCSGRCSGT